MSHRATAGEDQVPAKYKNSGKTPKTDIWLQVLWCLKEIALADFFARIPVCTPVTSTHLAAGYDLYTDHEVMNCIL